ncbi:TonB-dependent receptor [Phenylobacterium sp. LjRoot225]|uniref:TonB-dependent receptor n=1 Tax=Phenylobacterium sp. LjRoot225 TaxID=3342285 RepID=UPI003ECD55B9
MPSLNSSLRAKLAFTASAVVLSALSGLAHAEESVAAAQVSEVVVTSARTTRSAVALESREIQKILPGASPLKAIQTLPGVLFVTADPWGNNEQNAALFVHGFSTQQLGYTFDGVPLGDQQYGNYNGLSPSRALTSENVSRVVLASGAGALGVASTSNLGGAIETFSRDPSAERGFSVRQTVGSYETTRTFLRADSGDIGGGNSGYISYLHHDAKAWDFDGHQRGDQVNAKFVHQGDRGKLTAYFDWNDKVEPNEDSTAFGNAQTATSTYFPYTRPFLYPDLAACSSTLTNGAPPAFQGNNFSNCFSAAQREDLLGYVKYDYKVASNISWSNQAYYHHNYGRGIVAGPINQAGLPALFAAYFPELVVGSPTSPATLAAISAKFGGTGNEVRTTEYRINRGGLISTVNAEFGDHKIEAGVWWEHNEDAQHRAWYPFAAANNDLSPYDIPKHPLFIQYYAQFFVNDVQLHLQDHWRIRPDLRLEFGFKSSLQNATGKFPINQVNLPTVAVPVHYPSGSITSNKWFLPQAGLLWDATEHEQVFVNAQKNMRQFIPYGAGSGSPWSLGSQAAFDLFKQTVHPETSWNYEIGVRTQRQVDLGFLTAFSGQASAYHVNFKNRLLNIAAYNFINPGASVLANVGGVTTNGVDVAGTLEFGPHFRLYNAISYNKSTYDSDYQTGSATGAITTVRTGGKVVPLTPKWLNKTILSTSWGAFDAQLSADYVGSRYVTHLNDLSVKATTVVGLEAGYRFDVTGSTWLKAARVSANITNLFDRKGVSTAVVTGNSGGYAAFPLAPRMGFVTVAADF